MRLTDLIMAHAVAQQCSPDSLTFSAYIAAQGGGRIRFPHTPGSSRPPTMDRIVRVGHVDALTALREIVEANPGPFLTALGLAA